jgi:hypothetical protein
VVSAKNLKKSSSFTFPEISSREFSPIQMGEEKSSSLDTVWGSEGPLLDLLLDGAQASHQLKKCFSKNFFDFFKIPEIITVGM